MRKLTLLAAVSFAVTAVPAAATVNICTTPSCILPVDNVLITAATGATTITGTTSQSNVGVLFTSSTDLLNGDANGQADVSASDGLLNSLFFSTPGYYFTSATFNLFPLPANPLNQATSVIISYFTPGLGTQTITVSTNGQNFMGISGDAGEQFLSVGFTGNPATTGIQDLRQLRLGGVTALTSVPEPGTWAMMLLGFGAAGVAMRRSRRRKVLLAQVA
jgi:hypothetical protein